MSFRAILITAALLVVTGFAPVARSQVTADRTTLVGQVVELERTRLFGNDSLLVEKMFERLRQSATAEQWAAFKTDAARHLQSIIFRTDGPVVVGIKSHLETFSDAELSELVAILRAPVYQKYHDLAARATFVETSQKEVLLAIMGSAKAVQAIAKQHGITVPAR